MTSLTIERPGGTAVTLEISHQVTAPDTDPFRRSWTDWQGRGRQRDDRLHRRAMAIAVLIGIGLVLRVAWVLLQ